MIWQHVPGRPVWIDPPAPSVLLRTPGQDWELVTQKCPGKLRPVCASWPAQRFPSMSAAVESPGAPQNLITKHSFYLLTFLVHLKLTLFTQLPASSERDVPCFPKDLSLFMIPPCLILEIWTRKLHVTFWKFPVNIFVEKIQFGNSEKSCSYILNGLHLTNTLKMLE